MPDRVERPHRIDPSRIVVGCGSEELITVLTALTAGPGDQVVVPAPSFPRS